MIRTILWDLDGTLMNFAESEKNAIKACFLDFGLGECTDDMVARYSRINTLYWERLERGEMKKDRILQERFAAFFREEGIPFEHTAEFNADYEQRLGDTVCFNDNSPAVVGKLRGRVLQYLVTNGALEAQKKKLKASGMEPLFDGIFISDEVGYEKPDIRFFEHIFQSIPGSRSEMMIVGDSLTSDIRGGNNAGIVCCWYNPAGIKNNRGVHVDYEIRDLKQVEALLVRT